MLLRYWVAANLASSSATWPAVKGMRGPRLSDLRLPLELGELARSSGGAVVLVVVVVVMADSGTALRGAGDVGARIEIVVVSLSGEPTRDEMLLDKVSNMSMFMEEAR